MWVRMLSHPYVIASIIAIVAAVVLICIPTKFTRILGILALIGGSAALIYFLVFCSYFTVLG